MMHEKIKAVPPAAFHAQALPVVRRARLLTLLTSPPHAMFHWVPDTSANDRRETAVSFERIFGLPEEDYILVVMHTSMMLSQPAGGSLKIL